MTSQELKRTLAEASQVFVLTDEHVVSLWLAETKHWLGCRNAVDVVVPAGEGYKTLDTARQVWETLLSHHADRDAVLVNLGGGMVCDLGGFAAACYQRGIRFVNMPTTLLAMVDAAFGGKTGVDFGGAKNQLGVFAEPLEVSVNPVYLSTLPDRELRSGLAEMLKYGYVADPTMLAVGPDNYEQYLLRCGRIKRSVVLQDYRDEGSRKVLNFGHTVGHALESWSWGTGCPMRHGEAVALGMGCALWLSCRLVGLDPAVLEAYRPRMWQLLGFPWESDAVAGEGSALRAEELPSEAAASVGGALARPFALPGDDDLDAVLAYLVHDKKNRSGEFRFVLLEAPGKPVVDQPVPETLVRQSLQVVLDQCR